MAHSFPRTCKTGKLPYISLLIKNASLSMQKRIPQTVPSGTKFPLFLQPAPVGSPFQALGLGQEVGRVNISSWGNYSSAHFISNFSHLSFSLGLE